jgi:hypothetical protein
MSDPGMSRAYFYVGMSGVVWLVECALFCHFLQLAPWQVVLLALLYTALFGLAVRTFLRSLRRAGRPPADMATWRVVSLAPMIVAVLGSFVSLPIIVLVVLLGKL